MIEMKFRLWDCDNESFSKINFEDLERVVEELDSFRSYFSDSYFVGNNYLQQYTGLKDKNGKEIYEGDIINVPYNFIGDIIVRFDNGIYNVSKYNSSKIELIGNIHENPKTN